MPNLGLTLGIERTSKQFLPTDLGSMGMWWDFANKSFSDSGRTTPCTDGQGIASVLDLSGRSRHLAQGTSSLKPIWSTGLEAPDGVIESAAYFDGTDDYMTFGVGTYTYPANMTVYIVAQSVSSASAYTTLFGGGFDGSTTTNGFRLQHDSGAFNLRSTNGSANLDANKSPEKLNSWYYIAGKKEASSGVRVRANGTWGTLTAGTPVAQSTKPFFVGVRAAATSPFKGYIVEIIGYEVAHTDAEIALVEQYLRSKWQLSGT